MINFIFWHPIFPPDYFTAGKNIPVITGNIRINLLIYNNKIIVIKINILHVFYNIEHFICFEFFFGFILRCIGGFFLVWLFWKDFFFYFWSLNKPVVY